MVDCYFQRRTRLGGSIKKEEESSKTIRSFYIDIVTLSSLKGDGKALICASDAFENFYSLSSIVLPKEAITIDLLLGLGVRGRNVIAE